MREIKKYSGLNEIPDGRAGDRIQNGCLVIEGGAFRGLYNQGALDAMMLNDINIHTVIGVSAGALAGMNYVSGQIGRSARVNLGYRNDPRYVGRKALRNSRSILDVGFLLETYEQYEPLDRVRLGSPDRHFVAVVTNCLTGETAYYDKDNCSDILAAVRASASMPYITPMVDIDGVPCLDGGCSCKIAYRWAIDRNFDKIIVIKTRERGFRKPEKRHPAAKRFYKRYAAFAEVLSHSDEEYNRECREIDELEAREELYVIAPSQPVAVGRIEKDLEKLGDLYWLGYHDTIGQLDRIKQYLRE